MIGMISSIAFPLLANETLSNIKNINRQAKRRIKSFVE